MKDSHLSGVRLCLNSVTLSSLIANLLANEYTFDNLFKFICIMHSSDNVNINITKLLRIFANWVRKIVFPLKKNKS